ncbi:MAG: hypothetical protein WCO00_12580 [Rhodospirillaceae bacterium]
MLTEAFEALVTPCPGWARRAGLLHQAVSLRARQRRQRSAWAPHLEACRRFIAGAMARAPAGGRAVVLGSGLLIELPLAELAGHFAEVVLVDAIHGLPERWRLRRWRHLRPQVADLTGVLARLAAPDLPEPTLPLAGQRFDFAVSANILSQLPVCPLGVLAGRQPPEALIGFARALIRRHLDGLRVLAPLSCLISDFEHRFLDGERLLERDDPLYGVALPPPDAEWPWLIAPRPEESPDYDLCHRVGGWVFGQ